MHRTWMKAFTALALALITLTSVGIAAAPAAAEPAARGATGGFQGVLSGGANQNVAFSAHERRNGVIVGHISETLVSDGTVSRLRGEVTCLAVSGNRAAIGYRVLESTGVFALSMPVGSQEMFLVQDSDAGDTFAFADGPADCATAIAIEPIFRIRHGNITVRG